MSFNARHWEAHDPSMVGTWRAEEAARSGSERLAEAMRRVFMAKALKHRITIDDAMLFLQNGVKL